MQCLGIKKYGHLQNYSKNISAADQTRIVSSHIMTYIYIHTNI